MTIDNEPTRLIGENAAPTGTAGGYGKHVFAGAVINTLGSILISWSFIFIILIISQLMVAPKTERDVIPDSPARLFFMTPTYLCVIGPIVGAVLGAYIRYYQGSNATRVIASVVVVVSIIQLLLAFGLFASLNLGINSPLLFVSAFFTIMPLPGIVGSILVPLILPKWVPHIR